jgi:hypothetical protein
MKSSIKLTVVLLLLSSVVNNNVKAQGYKFSKEKTKSITRESGDNYGFTSKTLPTSYSLRKWAPTPGSQEGNTCVGWAMSYAAMSITYNKALNITDQYLKDLLSFDPLFLYLLSKDQSFNSCDSGVYMPDAANRMLENGCKRNMMPPLFIECEDTISNYTDRFSTPFKPLDIYGLDMDRSNSEKLLTIKSSIASGSPLPFAMETPLSLIGEENENPIPTGLWQPTANDKMFGGHAMCIIGYSDTKFGGAFEIMNSWGTDFGDGGFFWIKYNDLITRIEELYYIDPITVKSNYCKFGDCKNGYSVFTTEKKGLYEGMVTNELPNGYGIFTWPDNDTYAGGWKNGKQEGKALFFSKGEVYGCYYSNGELLSSEPLGFGKSETSAVTDKLIKELVKNKTVVKTEIPTKVFEGLENKSVDESWK